MTRSPRQAFKIGTAVALAAALLMLSCSGGSSDSSGKGAKPPATGVDAQLVEENNRGVGLMGRFDYAAAVDAFDGVLRKKPDWIDAKINLAIATLNRQLEGDEAGALKLVNEAQQADQSNLRARYVAGVLLQRTGEPADAEKALEHFLFVTNADPKDAYAAYRVGQCMRDQQKLAEALEWFIKATKLDPYLRSAYHNASQILSRLGRAAEAAEMAAAFERLASNPRARLVEDKYTRMGPKAEALAVDLAKPLPKSRPDGPIFADPMPLIAEDPKVVWRVRDPNRPVSITACDIDGDSDNDIFIAGVIDGPAPNAVCINQGDGRFALDQNHPLSRIADVNAALWGDFDNDGLTDVYLCRRGPNMLWRQIGKSQWTDVTQATGTSNGPLDTVDGAMVDFDHDGDLDIFCVNADGPNELLNNNLDGTFRPIAAERGLAGAGKGSRQVLPVDLDGDRDLDIIVINNEPPHDVWINDRLWQYRAAEGVEELKNARIDCIAAADLDSDGTVDLVTCTRSLSVDRWTFDGSRLRSTSLARVGDALSPPFVQMAIVDVAGDGRPAITRTVERGAVMLDAASGAPGGFPAHTQVDHLGAGWSPIALAPSKGMAIVGFGESGPLLLAPGPGRFPFAAVSFTGKLDPGAGPPPMRSNRSGIGTHFAARIDSMWVAGSTLRNSSGPGQSLQPVAIGLGGHDHLDFISIDWSDGVLQTEVHGLPTIPDSKPRDFSAGHVELIEELQRVKSSCPVLFVWNGSKFEFVSDLLGVGGLGYLVAPGEYAPPRPWENFLLPAGLLQPKDGQYVLKLSEPMEEACYLDATRLVRYRLPPGWSMTLDERMNIAGPEPTGQARFYRRSLLPVSAINDRGEDVTAAVLTADLRAAPVGALDSRFIGRLERDNIITFAFDKPLDAQSGEAMLVIDGWVEYPYCQTMFAAWQAGADYRAPTLEARGSDGAWRIVLEHFGYPAGMPRQMSVPLADLPAGTTQLRLSTNQEIYWDRVAVAFAEPCPEAQVQSLNLETARLAQTGFAERSTGPQRQPSYDYGRRVPFWDARLQSGFYTTFGPVTELVANADDALAIFGPGEEVHLEFAGPSNPNGSNPTDGWTERFVLEVNGWCKDMDLFTGGGSTLEPLPNVDRSHEAGRRLHPAFNSRFQSGP